MSNQEFDTRREKVNDSQNGVENRALPKIDSTKNSENAGQSSEREALSDKESRRRITELESKLKGLYLENLQGEVLDRRLSEILP
ncbi:MAG TPA: hypothetical protein PKA63_14660, partial [Oligoflexia bacterium]|nr:hypothetical protein [Oligoflexia bacterium]HMP49907.1 hypothetical protein [Oligoflexia bacterium]